MDPVELLDQAAHDRFFAEFCRIVDARQEAHAAQNSSDAQLGLGGVGDTTQEAA